MNTIQETKARLRQLSVAFATINDNYGITSTQQVNFATSMQELTDIIDNMADTPPPAPVTVDSVVAGIMAGVSKLQSSIDNSTNAGLHDVGQKIDALIALANSAGKQATA